MKTHCNTLQYLLNKNTRKIRKASHFLIGLFCNFGLTGLFLTEFWKPALWKCSYGPWDHFKFSVTSWFRLCFYQSDPVFSRKQQFSDYCIFAEFHNLQVGRRLALEEWIHVDGSAYMLIDPQIYQHSNRSVIY